MTAFLIILPLQARFPVLVKSREGWYLALLIGSVLVTVTMLMPVSIHRRLFGRGVKGEIVRWGNRVAKVALAGLGLLLSGCVCFIAALVAPGPIRGGCSAG